MNRAGVEQVGTRWRLHFRRRFDHDATRVWTALTDVDDLAAWFPDGIDGEWQVGSVLTFGSEQVGTFHGEVLRCEPPSLLEYTWGTDVLRWAIEPDGDGCVLTLQHTFAEQGKAARDGAGWHACLDALEARVDGRDPIDTGAVWAAVHPDYVADFGPDASSIGPPG
jgi:uncharacterized protein YndB with AHSA1/START domain